MWRLRAHSARYPSCFGLARVLSRKVGARAVHVPLRRQGDIASVGCHGSEMCDRIRHLFQDRVGPG